MAATQLDIDNYIVSIRDAYSVYANKVAKKELLGSLNLFCHRQKLSILTVYIEIVEKFFDDIYPNLIIGWVNGLFDTFVSDGTSITSAISDGSTHQMCDAIPTSPASPIFNIFRVEEGEEIVIEYTHTQNSGSLPYFFINYGGTVKSNIARVKEGYNKIILTSTISGDVSLTLTTYGNVATNFSTSDILVYRPYTDTNYSNFFTVEEIKEIMLCINKLLDTNYTIEGL